MRGSCRGISTTEYAIIFALVVVVAIAALGLLGGNTSERIAGILGSSGGGGQNDPGGSADKPVIDVKQISSIEVIRGINGEVIGYRATLNTGEGTQVTSVDGSVVVMKAMDDLQKLIDQTTAAGGGDPAVAAALEQFREAMGAYQGILAQHEANEAAFEYEAAQIAALENSGQHTPPPYHSSEVATSVFAQTETFLSMNSAFQNLSGVLEGNPEYTALQAQVNNLAGTVSTVAIADEIADTAGDAYAHRINPADIGTLATQYPQSLGFLATIQAETATEVGVNDGSDAYYDRFEQAFSSNIMDTANSKWMGSQDVSVASL